jgi:hypothetical protein
LLKRERLSRFPREHKSSFAQRHTRPCRDTFQDILPRAWDRRANLTAQRSGGAQQVSRTLWLILGVGDPRRTFEAVSKPQPLPTFLIARQRLAIALRCQLRLALSQRQITQTYQRLRAPRRIVLAPLQPETFI